MSHDPMILLDEARILVNEEDGTRARILLRKILPGIRDNSIGLASAGRLLLRIRAFGAALSCVRRVRVIAPEYGIGAFAAFDVCWTLGRFEEGLTALRAGLSLGDAPVERYLQAGDLLAGYGLWEEILSYAEEGLSRFPREVSLHHMGLRAALSIQDVSAARRHMTPLAATGDDGEWQAAQAMLELGLHDSLEEVLAKREGSSSKWLFLSGKLGLWTGQLNRAEEASAELLERGYREEGNHLQALLLIQAGEAAHGLELLTALPGTDERAVWKSEALRVLGRHHEAYRSAQEGLEHEGIHSLGGHLNMMLARFELDDLDGQNTLDVEGFRSLIDAVLPLSPDFDVVWSGRVRAVRALFEHALERFGGNRSAYPTTVEPEGEGGGCALFERTTLFPSEAVTGVMRRLLIERAGELQKELIVLLPSEPARLALAELSLRLGHYEKSEEYLAGLPEEKTRIFRAGIAMARGGHSEAFRMLVNDEAPWARLVRAEALLRQGETDEARAELSGFHEGPTESVRSALLWAGIENDSEALGRILRNYPVIEEQMRSSNVHGDAHDSTARALGALSLLSSAVTGRLETILSAEGLLLGVPLSELN